MRAVLVVEFDLPDDAPGDTMSTLARHVGDGLSEQMPQVRQVWAAIREDAAAVMAVLNPPAPDATEAADDHGVPLETFVCCTPAMRSCSWPETDCYVNGPGAPDATEVQP